MSLMFALATNAQELPFGEYLKYTPEQLKEAGFKFRNRWNHWFPKHAELPAPIIELGKNGEIAKIDVVLWSKRDSVTVQSLTAFMKENGANFTDEKYIDREDEFAIYSIERMQCTYDNYVLLLEKRTVTHKTDDHHSERLCYSIQTGVEQWSRVTERWQRQRDRKAAKEGTTTSAE